MLLLVSKRFFHGRCALTSKSLLHKKVPSLSIRSIFETYKSNCFSCFFIKEFYKEYLKNIYTHVQPHFRVRLFFVITISSKPGQPMSGFSYMIKCLWFRSDEGVAPYIGLSNIKRSCPNPPTNPNLKYTKTAKVSFLGGFSVIF